jgi:hypothetical protein
MNLFVLLILAAFASEKKNNVDNYQKNEERIGNDEENSIVVKIEKDEYAKVNIKSKYIGVSYHINNSKWQAQRRSKKNGKKVVSNGYYGDEANAAHASDTLAKKLMENGENGHKLNFPDNNIEVSREEKRYSSKFIGVSYHKKRSKWCAQRCGKNENNIVYQRILRR